MEPEVQSLFKTLLDLRQKNLWLHRALAANQQVQGIVYISSFACGIDSVIIELVGDRTGIPHAGTEDRQSILARLGGHQD